MILLAEFEPKSYVFLVLMLGVTAWMLFRIVLRTKHKDVQRPVPRMTNAARSLGSAPPPEHDRWSVEMQDLARDMLAQIDTKMRALEYLTTRATAAADRLEAATAIADDAPLAREPVAHELVSHASSESPDTQSEPHTQSEPRTHSEPDTHSQADVLERTTGRTHDDDAVAGRIRDDAEPRHAAIYHLADQGRAVEAIATEVGSPVGEVQLILGLREQGV